MILITSSLLALSLAGTRGAAINNDWLVASGTGDCSVTDIDFPDSPRGFAAGAFNCGLLTEDGGLNWTPIDVVPDQGQSLVWSHATTADELYAARLGLYRSTDRGQTWSELGPLVGDAGSIFDVAFPSDGRLVAIRGGQLQASGDAGATWTITFEGEFGISFSELHFPSATVGYATGGVTRDGGSSGNVFRSDDAGDSWTPLGFTHGQITAADFFDVDHGIVATFDQGLFSTDDGGATWQPLSATPDAGLIDDLAHRDALHWYAVSTLGCVYTSGDGGQNWREGFCDTDQRALTAISLRGGAAVAAGNDGLVIYENAIFGDGFDEI